MVSKTGYFGSADNSTVDPSVVSPNMVYRTVNHLVSTDPSFEEYVELNSHDMGLASVERGYIRSPHFSDAPALRVDGIEPLSPFPGSTCFHRLCASLGVPTPRDICRVADLRDDVLLELQSKAKYAKVFFDFTSIQAKSNHITVVSPTVNSSKIVLTSPYSAGHVSVADERQLGVTNLVQFFNKKNAYAQIMFFADLSPAGEEFGSDNPSGTSPALSFARNGRSAATQGGALRDQSISDPQASHGQANLNSGVIRPKRRVTAARSKFNPTGAVVKGYVSSNTVQFNNLREIFLDTISREYAQDIIEELFELWGIDSSQPDAVKYAEDLIWAFIIAVTASNKAAYNKEFDVPHKAGSVLVNFDVFSRLLAEGHGVTRRQFARAVADDMHKYIREPENLHLLPLLASRVGSDPQMAALAFDGSTHCTGLTSAEQSFTKLLERRNLFEDDSVLAEGASQRLMQGMSSGPRSIISR